MTIENCKVIKQNTSLPNPKYPNTKPKKIRVNEIGKPIKIANNILDIPDISNYFEEEKNYLGTDFIPLKEREIIALIAYLQRLGTDIKVVDAKD